MADRDSGRVTRRVALQSAGVVGAAAAIGCGSDLEPRMPAPPLPDVTEGGWNPNGPFQFGVASGDPTPDAVILWTRLDAPATGRWEMVYDWNDFSRPVASGEFSAELDRDGTVKIDVTGLEPDTVYFYRFVLSTGETSPIARTRTAPSPDSEKGIRFVVCSCSSYAHGYFHGYKQIALRDDIDAVIHLGDYIYEYGNSDYGDVRSYDPPHEIVSLEDYRRRYAHYRRDSDLLEAHRAHPFITIWDDHESANNSYADGAENHDPATEGLWSTRKQVAQRAYDEWMPIRTSAEGPSRIYRALRFGALVELILLDTRLEGRTMQGLDPEESRRLLSDAQRDFALDRLRGSDAHWKLMGQQVMVSPLPLPINDDQWDGYSVSRQQIFGAVRDERIENVVVLTGDIHSSWAMEVVLENGETNPAGVEFVCPGITSPGLSAAVEGLLRGIISLSPHIRFFDLSRRGYIVLDITREQIQANYRFLIDVESATEDGEMAGPIWYVETGTPKLLRG